MSGTRNFLGVLTMINQMIEAIKRRPNMQKRTGKSKRLPVRFSKLDRAKLLAYRVECCGAIAETDLRGIA